MTSMTKSDIRIINMHAHIFPQKISEKAVAAIGGFYGIPMQIEGTPEAIIKDGAEIGVYKYVVSSTATTPRQVQSVNNFIASEQEKHSEFIGFGSLHPEYEDIECEIERIISLGLHGIKLHSDFQRFDIDDSKAFPIYEAAEGRLPILFHMGDSRYEYSSPEKLCRVLDRFPGLTAIAAHLGGYQRWDDARVLIGRPQVYIDTSSSLMFVQPEKAVQIIRDHGIERVFFGTDSPMWRHRDELERFDRLGLTPYERARILYYNAAEFLGIE